MFLARRGERTIAAVVRHMDHVRRTVGARHVALGSDYDGFITPVAGLEDVSRLGALTAALLAAGWPEDDVRAALGENVLRVLAAHDARGPR
jgi:membrane dipeptidase